MKFAAGLPRTFSASLFVMLVTAVFLKAATVPIADGNTWVYRHSDTLKDSTVYSPSASVVSSQDGLFTMKMDSVTVRIDTVFFIMTTIDSGITKTGSVYNIRVVKRYRVLNGVVEFRDTASGLWVSCYDEYIYWVLRSDTSSSWHQGIDNSSYTSDTSFSRSRHTDSSAVLINGTATATLYTADTSFSWASVWHDKILGNFIYPFSSISRDTIQWLDSIGMFYHIFKKDSASYLQSLSFRMSSFRETYSLLSFNGTPVSITPDNAQAKSLVPAAKQIFPNRNRKIIWLGTAPYRQSESVRCLNLLGRQLNGIERAQLLIKKDEQHPTVR